MADYEIRFPNAPDTNLYYRCRVLENAFKSFHVENVSMRFVKSAAGRLEEHLKLSILLL